MLLVGQSRGGYLAIHYAGLKPGEVMGVVSFSGGRYPYAPVTTPDFAKAGRGATNKVPQLWLYADNDHLYDQAMIRGYYQAFVAAGGSARFELLHGVPGDGHLLRLYPDRWRPIANHPWQRSTCKGAKCQRIMSPPRKHPSFAEATRQAESLLSAALNTR